MTTFKDSKERQYTLALNCLLEAKILAVTTVDIFKLFSKDGSAEIAKLGDPRIIIKIIWIIIEKEAKEKGISHDDFLEAIDGDVLESAGKAFIQESLNFSSPQNQAQWKTVLGKIESGLGQRNMEAMKSLEQMPAEKILELAGLNGRGKSAGTAE